MVPRHICSQNNSHILKISKKMQVCCRTSIRNFRWRWQNPEPSPITCLCHCLWDARMGVTFDFSLLCCGPSASQFMAYHKPLRNSEDFTEALRTSRLLAANITAELRKVPGTDPDFEVFPYT